MSNLVETSGVQKQPAPDITYFKGLTQKYEGWFDSVQEPLRAIGACLGTAKDKGNTKTKLSLKEMRIIICNGAQMMGEQQEALHNKSQAAAEVHMQHERLLHDVANEKATREQQQRDLALRTEAAERKVQELAAMVAARTSEVDRAKNERARLEAQLQRQREDTGKMYERGTDCIGLRRSQRGDVGPGTRILAAATQQGPRRRTPRRPKAAAHISRRCATPT